MRFRPLILSATALTLLASCGDAKVISPENSTAPSSAATAAPEVTSPAVVESVPAAPGALPKPEVKIPAALPTKLEITDLTEGTGPAAAEGDTVVVHYIGVRSADGTEFDNSFDRGQPFPVGPLGTAGVIDGWNQGLVGVKQGGRRQMDIPADLAYGDKGSGDIIKPGDALTFVVDVVAVIPKSDPANAPTISIPATPNSTEQTLTDLVVGDGAETTPGQTVIVQYLAFSAADGKQLESSWETGNAFTFVLGDGQMNAAIEAGVNGMKVGGRRQVSLPFADSIGPDGDPQLGLPPSTDLILVLDLVAAY
jgi:peptidylprolyl isomerase